MYTTQQQCSRVVWSSNQTKCEVGIRRRRRRLQAIHVPQTCTYFCKRLYVLECVKMRTARSMRRTVCSMWRTVRSMRRIVRSMWRAVCSIWRTVCSVRRTVWNVWKTVWSVRKTVWSVWRTVRKLEGRADECLYFSINQILSFFQNSGPNLLELRRLWSLGIVDPGVIRTFGHEGCYQLHRQSSFDHIE